MALSATGPAAAQPLAADWSLEQGGDAPLGTRSGTRWGRRLLLTALVVGPLSLGLALAAPRLHRALVVAVERPASVSAVAPDPPARFPRVPTGVNLGGWLCLEDWFYSGTGGRFVSTGDAQPQGQGACLPPLLPQLPEHWPSEGILTRRLNDTKGAAKTAEILMAHRRSFMGNNDLEAMAAAGIRQVRVPLTWAAFADALKPFDARAYGSHDPDNEAAVVPDPFYRGTAAFVTVPRAWLAGFLRKAGQYKLKVLLDLHAFPGGSSNGTYSGVWPQPPVFWRRNATTDGASTALEDLGQLVAKALVEWVEGLDAAAQGAVGGLTLMNEPAHLSKGHTWASEGQILQWLETSAEAFRSSTLPGRGVKLYVNVIETAFQDFEGTVGPWWTKTFSEAERNQWAVMDRHWYTAWSGNSCSGRTSRGGGYDCDQAQDEIREKLRDCATGWAKDFAKQFTGLKAVSEFSMGTFDDALAACTDPMVTATLLDEQVAAFAAADIEPFFWTWRMPYGPLFEPGWSLKRQLGLEDTKVPLPCLPPLSTQTCRPAAP